MRLLAKALPWFGHIEIQSDTYRLIYKGKTARLLWGDLEITARIDPQNERDFEDVRVHIKKYDFVFAGKGAVRGSRIFLWGAYSLGGIRGGMEAVYLPATKRLTLFADSDPFDPDILRDSPFVPAFIKRALQNLKAAKAQLRYLVGSTSIHSPGLKDFEGVLELEDLRYRFAKELPPLQAAGAALSLQNGRVHIAATRPFWEKKALRRLEVLIDPLGAPKIAIDLSLTAPIDHKIGALVRRYGIDLPFVQSSGATRADLKILLWPKSGKKEITGSFGIGRGELCFSGSGLCLLVQDLAAKLAGGRLTIRGGAIGYKDLLSCRVRGELTPADRTGALVCDPLRLDLVSGKMELLRIPGLRERVRIAPNRLEFATLGAVYRTDSRRLELADLSALLPYSPLARRLQIAGGRLSVDFAARKAEGAVKLQESPFARGQKAIEELQISMDLARRLLKIADFGLLDLKKSPPRLQLGDITLVLRNPQKPKGPQKERLPDLDGDLRDLTLRYKNHRLHLKNGALQIRNNTLRLQAKGSRADIWIQKEQNLTLAAKGMDERELADLMGARIFHGGSYDLRIDRSGQKITGLLKIRRAHIKGFALVNNLFAFLNTIPALATFSDPGFSTEGLPVDEGVVEFALQNGRLLIKNIYLTSPALTVAGYGWVDLAGKSVRLDLQLQTLKKVSGLLGKIPVVGYILLGEEGTIATQIKIRGTLDRPEFESELPKETLTYPFKLIGRTIELPFRMLR